MPPEGGAKLTAFFEGDAVGFLSPAASKQMHQAIDLATANGRSVFAVAEAKGNSLAADIKLLVAPAEDLTEAEIRLVTG